MKKSLLGFFVDMIRVNFQFKVIADVGSKEFKFISDANGYTFNEHRSFGRWLTSKIDDKFLCF